MHRQTDIDSTFRPVYVVWELTLKCDLACRHCGSRAGRPRDEEMSLDEAKAIADQLQQMGSKEVTFIGGEAYLYPFWEEIVAYTSSLGMVTTMTTGARALSQDKCLRLANAGMSAISISLDGLEGTHDTLRAVKGSFQNAIQAVADIQNAGMVAHANTQINRLNKDELWALGHLLMQKGVRSWQVQLTGAMGRAADRPDWLLQPYELLEIMPLLERLSLKGREQGFVLNAANNLGYYGPVESNIRHQYWKGCGAGRHVLGIESNGAVKGCPSLPSEPYIGGNLRHNSLQEIWNTQRLAFAREDRQHELWGHCKGCYYAKICKGGCSWTSHTLLGKRGNMPYCYHRAQELARKGIAEIVTLKEKASGNPFDFGLYELKEIPLPQHLQSI